MITCIKRFADIPFAHRQHNHPGHCRFIHGHNWAFTFEFTARELNACGFVIDFGGDTMKGVKNWINATFDHKLVLNEADPFRRQITDALTHVLVPAVTEPVDEGCPRYDFADIVVLPDGSAEGLAKWLFRAVSERVYQATHGRVQLVRVTVEEDERNSATFKP